MATYHLSHASEWTAGPKRDRSTCICGACKWNDEMERLVGRLIQGGHGVEVLGSKPCEMSAHWDEVEAAASQ